MSVAPKYRRNALLAGAGLFAFAILQLLVAYHGYKAHELIPAGHVSEHFMTPTQGFIIASIAFAFSVYAFTRALLARRNHS